MRKAIFILLSLLLVVSIVAIPADNVRARPASSPLLSSLSPAQQQDEEAIIKRMLGQLDEAKDILDELKQAGQLTEDMDIRDQIDAIIEKVKKIEGLIKAGQSEAALEEKRALSKELEVLAMGYGPGETEAMTRADFDELTKAREKLIAASEKIGNLGPEEALTKDMVDEVRDILKELGFDDDLGSDDSPDVVTTEGTTLGPTEPEVGEPIEAEIDKITVQNAIGEVLFFLNLAISAAETKLALHRVNRQLVLAFHTLQELIAAELPTAEEGEKPIEVEVAPPGVEPVGPLPGVPGAVPPEEEHEEEKEEVEKAVDEHMKILERLRQEAEVKASEKDKSEEEAQKSQEAFEKLDEWLGGADMVVRREVVEEEPAEPVETEMVPLELVGPGPIVVHIETPPSEEALSPMEVPTSSRIDVSMFKCITENSEAEVKITAPIVSEASWVGKEITIEVKGSEVILRDEGTEVKTTLPLVIEGNRLYCGEDDFLYPINLLPGEIEDGLEIAPGEISLESDENQNPVYKVRLEEQARFLFIPLKLTREVKVDPDSTEVLSIKQPWWNFLTSKSDIPEALYTASAPPEPSEKCTQIFKVCNCPYIYNIGVLEPSTGTFLVGISASDSRFDIVRGKKKTVRYIDRRTGNLKSKTVWDGVSEGSVEWKQHGVKYSVKITKENDCLKVQFTSPYYNKFLFQVMCLDEDGKTVKVYKNGTARWHHDILCDGPCPSEEDPYRNCEKRFFGCVKLIVDLSCLDKPDDAKSELVKILRSEYKSKKATVVQDKYVQGVAVLRVCIDKCGDDVLNKLQSFMSKYGLKVKSRNGRAVSIGCVTATEPESNNH